MNEPVYHSWSLECDSGEPDLGSLRNCTLLARISVGQRDDCWLAEVDPPYPGKYFGLPEDIGQVVIATKWEGHSLAHDGASGVPVYVARIVGGHIASIEVVKPDQIKVILWCTARRAG